ncbi:MAG: glycosyl hydrolase family 18 protein [Planctomycetota bacterium]|nr:glycosyl hydrolase family 18 protein [Planctomycetota bacterium]
MRLSKLNSNRKQRFSSRFMSVMLTSILTLSACGSSGGGGSGPAPSATPSQTPTPAPAPTPTPTPTPALAVLTLSAPSPMNEGNSGNSVFRWTLNLSQSASSLVTVDFQSKDGSASAPSDYVQLQGQMSFQPGEVTKTIDVLVNGDTNAEPDETFSVELSNVRNATLSNNSVSCTILNDDPATSPPPTPPAGTQRMVMAYVESLRFGYTAQIPQLDYSAVDVVIHGFITPDAQGNLSENGNFNDFRTWPWATAPDVPLPTAVHNAGKKIVMSIGGATVAPSLFDTIASNPTNRANFIQNIIQSINSFGYDGVDIDYEWPAGVRQGQDFTTLMTELYAAVKANNSQHLVIFGAGPGNWIGYREWAKLGAACDYCFFFGYDWRNPALGPMKAANNAQFTSHSGDQFEAAVRGAVNFVLSKGFPANQLIVGIPFYSSGNQSWSAAQSAAWSAGAPWTVDPDYMEVNMGTGGWWTTPESVTAKMDALLHPQKTILNNQAVLGGIGWWEWGHEDPSNPDLTNAVKQWIANNP